MSDRTEIMRIEAKRYRGNINHDTALDAINPIYEYANQLSRAIDVTLMEFLSQRIGAGWELDKVSILEINPGLFNYFIMYEGKPIGRLRYTTTSTDYRITGNVYIELLEEESKE